VSAGSAAFRSSLTQTSDEEYARKLGSIKNQPDMDGFAKRIVSEYRDSLPGLFNYLARQADGTQLARLFESFNKFPLQSEAGELASAVVSSAPAGTKVAFIRGIAPLTVRNQSEQKRSASDAAGKVLATLTEKNFDAAIDSLEDDRLPAVARGGYEKANQDITKRYAEQFISILIAARSGKDPKVKSRLSALGTAESRNDHLKNMSPELADRMANAAKELLPKR
jgi:hypothetical protein